MKLAFMIFVYFIASHLCFAVQKVHFSIDDVNAVLRDLTENEKKYDSLFDQKFFKYLKNLNEKYGAKITLYCFYELNDFCLADCTEKFKKEFSASSEWLKFGYHAYNGTSVFYNYGGGYKMFVESVLKFAGSGQCVSQTVRLDHFSGRREECAACSYRNMEYGIRQLLTADSRTRQSYYLSDAEIADLNDRELYVDWSTGIEFYSTDFRFDDCKNFKRLCKENMGESEVVVFTHEWLLNVPVRRNVAKYVVAKWYQYRIWHNINRFCMKAVKNEYFFDESL